MLAETESVHGAVSVAAMLLLSAFAVDRLANGITFLAFRPPEEKQSPEEESRREWKRKLFYYAASAAIVIPLLLVMDDIRLLVAMDMLTKPISLTAKFVDYALTFLVLVGGGERISSFLGAGGGGKSEAPQPVHLTVSASGESATKAGAASGGH